VAAAALAAVVVVLLAAASMMGRARAGGVRNATTCERWR